MPSWVTPVVAAELWGVSPGHVLAAIADGSLPSRKEYGFVLVDVAPDGACPATRPRHGPPPPTYTVVSYDDAPEQVELAVLAELAQTPHDSEPCDSVPLVPVILPPDESTSDELPPLDEEEDDKPITHWRQVRSSTGRTRKPPMRQPPAAFAA